MKCIALNGKKIFRRIAFFLIIMSFVLYAIMPFNMCLPCSTYTIAGITGAMAIVSEIIFWIGGLMIGREFARKIRQRFSMKNLIHLIKGRKKE